MESVITESVNFTSAFPPVSATPLRVTRENNSRRASIEPVLPLRDIIFNEIKQDIESIRPSWEPVPEWELNTFLNSPKAQKIGAQIQRLTQNEKNNLMRQIGTIAVGSLYWPQTRDYLALSIRAGAYVDFHVFPPGSLRTFLGKSLVHSDFSATSFALEHGAHTQQSAFRLNPPVLNEYPLGMAKKYRIAKALVEHNGLKPYIDNQEEQFNLLYHIYDSDYETRLFEYYRDLGLNFNLKSRQNSTLLHWLCRGTGSFGRLNPGTFFERFLILFKAGAIDIDARNNDNQRPIDIINNRNQNNQTVIFAKRLLEDLEKHNKMLKNLEKYNLVLAELESSFR